MVALAPGQQLGQRFTLIRSLGEGGMGMVWLVEDHHLEERVVIKLLSPDAPSQWLTLLKNECRNARRLVHPNIVRVYDFHIEGPHSFLSMAYVEGKDISQLRGRALEEILDVAARIADALDYAHRQGVLHRDLKSNNVLLDESGEPRIVDFGVAGLLASYPSATSASDIAEPTIGDDVRGFGGLLYDLLGDARPPLPEGLTSLLTALLSDEAPRRFGTMGDVREAVERIRQDLVRGSSSEGGPAASRPAKAAVTLAPPPRVVRAERILPRTPASRASAAAANGKGSGRWGWPMGATFALLVAALGGVFFWLPRWAPDPARSAPAQTVEAPELAPPESPPAAPGTDAPSLQEQAQWKTRAEELRDEALTLRSGLEQKQAPQWSGVGYRNAVAAMDDAERALQERAYEKAAAIYQDSLAALQDVAARSQDVLRQALADGSQALETGDSPAAIAAFELAATIDPENEAAAIGLSRARVSTELVRLLAQGAEQERRGDAAGALGTYRKAVSLDPHSQRARLALARAEGNLTEVAFRTAMSNGLEALNRQDYQEARQLFQQAGEIRQGDHQVEAGIAQAEEGLRLQAIAAHRENAARFESEEQWHQASEQYGAVLKLDPTIRFAQQGKARTDERAAVEDQIQYHLTHPERLSDENVLATVAALLEKTEGLAPAGPRLVSQRAQLGELVSQAATPVSVLLQSDNETEITVYKIGALGRFESHTLQLRPGTYTVVGSRPGYRDVRLSLRIEAGKDPEPIVVRCEEKI